ncbi:MAG TPA: sulfoxide reductase heme-binding subunit YedZ [Chromatiales bacterium]|nr:sulfoxide reductase heme-binding subunit YedZ [Chromatiales bacterium]
MRNFSSSRWLRFGLKPAVFLLALAPIGLVVWDAWQDALGANPIEAVTHRTGDWTLRFLLLTLGITPLRRITGWRWPMRFRRMLGLFAFFYATLHLATWLVLDQFFDWQAIVEDIVKRPYITVGFTAWLLLVPLAATSTRGMMRRLGSRWVRLHRLVYLVAVLGVLHFWWLVKADVLEPAVYALILSALLGYRMFANRRTRLRSPVTA